MEIQVAYRDVAKLGGYRPIAALMYLGYVKIPNEQNTVEILGYGTCKVISTYQYKNHKIVLYTRG